MYHGLWGNLNYSIKLLIAFFELDHLLFANSAKTIGFFLFAGFGVVSRVPQCAHEAGLQTFSLEAFKCLVK